MRPTSLVAMLIVGFSGLFVGVGAPTAIVLGYVAAILVLSFVVPRAARGVAVLGLAVALGFAIMWAGVAGTECSPAPQPTGFAIPLVREIEHALSTPCAKARAARATKRQLGIASLALCSVGCAGAISLLLARPRRRVSEPLPVDMGFRR